MAGSATGIPDLMSALDQVSRSLGRKWKAMIGRVSLQNHEDVKCRNETVWSFLKEIGGPNGSRTRVTDVRGRCPRPLDDGTADGCFVAEVS